MAGQGDVAITEIKPVRRERPARRQLDNPNPEARQRLLDAAQSLVEEHGETGVKVGEVARRAGLSVGTFYLYFEGKADLLVQLVQARTDELRQRMATARTGARSIAEQLDRSLDAYLDFVEESPQAFRHFLGAGSLETTAGRLSTWALDQHAADLQPLLEQAMADGEIRQHDPALLAQAVTALTQHLAGFWVEHDHQVRREDIVHFVRSFTAFGFSP